MKKIGVWVVLLLFLAGCSGGSGEMDRAMELRGRLLKAERCSFNLEITADYGQELYRFAMACQSDKDGSVAFTVTEPETIAGISGRIQEEGGELIFDETALYFDLLTDDQLSPVSAPWILIRTLRSGYITSVCEEDPLLRMTVDDRFEEDALMLDIWLDEQDLPVSAEILYDGRRILTLNVKDMVIS